LSPLPSVLRRLATKLVLVSGVVAALLSAQPGPAHAVPEPAASLVPDRATQQTDLQSTDGGVSGRKVH
jgi:hypothetical protein